MNKEQIAKIIKAVAAVAAVAGVVITPDQQEAIVSGFLAIYAVISAIETKFKGDT